MPFDPYLVQQFEHIKDFTSFDDAFSSPEGMARYFQYSADPAPWTMPAGVSTEDRSVDGPHGPIPVRIYRSAAASADAPGLLWMHGGAFMFGDLEMNESNVVSAELAHRAGAVVVAVDYRLAVGGVKYPVPLDDVVAAWTWLVESASGLGIDPARISIGGASAGGNLATSASMRIRDEGGTLPHAMLLAYPLVHFPVPSLEPEVAAEMLALPPLLHFPVAFHEANLMNHLGRFTNVPAGIAPGNHALEGMPPAWIGVAEFDELRPSGDLFARQLESVGVAVQHHVVTGFVHGYLDRTPSVPAVDAELDFFAKALSEDA